MYIFYVMFILIKTYYNAILIQVTLGNVTKLFEKYGYF